MKMAGKMNNHGRIMLARLMLRPAFSRARREQDFVEQLIGEVEVTEATADTEEDDE